MKVAFRSPDLLRFGFAVNLPAKLLVIYFTPKANRRSINGHDYPHISIYCSTLTEVAKAYGSEITADFDRFHISFDDARKVWKLATPASAADSPVIITDDKSQASATLGITAQNGSRTVTVDDICNDILLPILRQRAIVVQTQVAPPAVLGPVVQGPTHFPPAQLLAAAIRARELDAEDARNG